MCIRDRFLCIPCGACPYSCRRLANPFRMGRLLQDLSTKGFTINEASCLDSHYRFCRINDRHVVIYGEAIWTSYWRHAISLYRWWCCITSQFLLLFLAHLVCKRRKISTIKDYGFKPYKLLSYTVNPEGVQNNPEAAWINAEVMRINPEAVQINPEAGLINTEAVRINPEAGLINTEAERINTEDGLWSSIILYFLNKLTYNAN